MKKKTFNERVGEFKRVHGDKYYYPLNQDLELGAKTKIKIICPKHGEFHKSVTKHLSGKQGCPRCGYSRIGEALTLKTDDFISRSKEVHGDKYYYKETVYYNAKTKVKIVCPAHGAFYQIPHSHIAGAGCPDCSPYRNRYTKERVLKISKEVHGDKYRYIINDEDVLTKESKLSIVCPQHGIFLQRLDNHLKQGSGCKSCSEDSAGDRWNPICAYGIAGYYGTKNPSNLYVLQINDSFIKVGLAKEIFYRMNTINKESGYSVEKLYSISGKANELFELEQKILRKSNLKRFYPEESFAGSTECLELSELPKVLQIIEDWEKSSEESFSETP